MNPRESGNSRAIPRESVQELQEEEEGSHSQGKCTGTPRGRRRGIIPWENAFSKGAHGISDLIFFTHFPLGPSGYLIFKWSGVVRLNLNLHLCMFKTEDFLGTCSFVLGMNSRLYLHLAIVL